MRVLAAGADGCRGGWVLAHRYRRDDGAEASALSLEPGFAELLDRHAEWGRPPLGIDIPIGLPELGGPRSCDQKARALLGGRSGSVFTPPGRFLLALHDRPYAELRAEIARRRERGERIAGLSAQSAGLLPKIHEVDAALRADPFLNESVFEVHPELAFRRAIGTDPGPKRSPAGQRERLRFVEATYGPLAPLLNEGPWRSSAADLTDVLDAFAVLDTALRWPEGVETLDGEPDGAGMPMRIVARAPR